MLLTMPVSNAKLLFEFPHKLTSLWNSAGNTVLHKAIQVCTSKNVAAIVSTLLSKGANAKAKNKDGDTPLHSECLRFETAAFHVPLQIVKVFKFKPGYGAHLRKLYLRLYLRVQMLTVKIFIILR